MPVEMATTGSPLVLRKRELFRTIGYEPLAVQLEAHRSTARIRVLACGTRYGKSTCAAAEVLAAVLAPRERSLGWVVGPSLEVTSRVIDRVGMLLHEHFPARIEKDQGRDKRIVVRNLGGGLSELRGKSADAPSSLLGAELDWLVVDECAQIKVSVWQSHLAARLLDRRGWALLVGTPGKMDWYFDLFQRGQSGTDPDCRSWRAPTWDNPHVARDLIEAERASLPADVFAQQYEARFLLEPPERCGTCGFPTETPPKWYFVCDASKLLYCRTCRGLVNRLGRTLIQRRPDGSFLHYALLDGMPGDGDPENE